MPIASELPDTLPATPLCAERIHPGGTVMKSDSDLKRDADNELTWNPEIDSTDIATKATSGTVTLSGFARNFFEKHQAEVTVKRVAGVAAVANDLAVRPKQADRVSDPQLAREAVAALQTALPACSQSIKIMVHEGQVVLEGTVEWDYLRERAAKAIRHLRGVLDVRNSIKLQPTIVASDIKGDIDDAFKRNAIIDSEQVTVEVQGSQVTLRGEVRSWSERDQAYKVAASAPGVTNVVDELAIRT
jgi:osmotically-inducible protein OsmY